MYRSHATAVLAVSLAASLSAFSLPRLDGITREAYPDADSVLVDAFETYDVRPDGTYLNVSEQWIKILTEKGRREESVIELQYSERYAASRVVSVSVIGADGAERAVDVSATTKETTDNSSAESNIYDPHQRKIVCTVPGLKVGDTVYYKTEKDVKKARVENNYSDIFVLEWSCPIVKSTVRVRMPKSLPLKTVSVRNPLGNIVSDKTVEADGSILYTWTATNSPQAFPEPDMPPLYTQLQNVRVSTAADWPEISRWYWNLCVPHLEKTNPAITNKVSEIVKGGSGLPTALQKEKNLSAIYKWVAQEVRYMGLTMEDTSPGYAPHDVSITFDNRYGVCRDKAALLAVMLRIAGFEAYPVLIHAGAKMDEEVPLPFFNHAIVAVRMPAGSDTHGILPNKDGFVLMDPTDESSRDIFPSYLCGKSYLVATPEGEGLHLSQIVPAEANAVKIASEGTLDADGSILLESTVEMGGINDNAYRSGFLGRKPDERRKFVERIVRSAAPGAEVLSLAIEPENLQDTTKPLSLRFTAKVPEAILRGETIDEFSAPLFSRSFGMANFLLRGSTSLEKRRFPLDISSTAMTDEKLVVRHGGNVGPVRTLPEDADVGADGSPYSFRRSFKATDEEIVVTRKLSINNVEFSPKEYADLREDIKRVEAAERERPFFSKNSAKEADVRYVLARTDCAVSSPFAWTITNTVEKEILTYDGKKNSAELTFSWNPLVKNVELLYATVSNRNGRVYSVSAKEKNVFDCTWAASAPRYPASKQLVVNLPSVEVGSVISYQTVTTVTNSPAAFYKTFYFDVFEPTDRLEVSCKTPWKSQTFDEKRENPKLLKREPMQPDGRLWRDHATVSFGDFKSLAARLRKACDVKGIKEKSIDLAQKYDLGDDVLFFVSDASESGRKEFSAKLGAVKAIRDWMHRNVRVAGPSLFEVPLESQLTDPETVLKERYATRLDYVRTLAALLRGAGFAADVVFAASDDDVNADLRENMLSFPPCERMFAHALCRVKFKTGGFMGFGGREHTFFIGLENEYAPMGASTFAGSDYLDPATGEISSIDIQDDDLTEKLDKIYVITLRENGAADIDVEERVYGPDVGGLRKRYAEMLPEDRSRHHQELLGSIAQAATATGDLFTDVESYPFRRSFSCYVPNYATLGKDTMTLSLPEIGAHIFPLAGTKRETPIAIGARESSSVEIEYEFPKGYETLERMPESMDIATREVSPMYEYASEFSYRSGSVRRHTYKRRDDMLSPLWFEHLKSLDSRVTSRANRTVTVRKGK